MPASSVSKSMGRIARRRKSFGKYTKRKFRKGYSRTSGYYGRFHKGGEDKFFDTALSFTFDSAAIVPATGQLTLIPQGVTESTRVGRKCTITSIYIIGSVNNVPAASATSSVMCYLYLILDTQTNGAAAATTDVFTSASLQSAMRNLSNESRFRVLKKFRLSFNSNAGVTTAYNSYRRDIKYFKKCNIPIEYSSTTGAITEIRSNNLFLIAGATGADNTSTMDGACRLRFSDN